MDIFRSITITLAIILLVFMAMIMYYEFKTKLSNASWPPYSRRCPDYSYDDVSIHTEINQTGPLCKFNDQFDYNTFISYIPIEKYSIKDWFVFNKKNYEEVIKSDKLDIKINFKLFDEFDSNCSKILNNCLKIKSSILIQVSNLFLWIRRP